MTSRTDRLTAALVVDTVPYELAKDMLRIQPWHDTTYPTEVSRLCARHRRNDHHWRPAIRYTRRRRSLTPELVIAVTATVLAFALGRWSR